MRTFIKLLMLLVTVAFVGVNVLSFVVSSRAVRETTAENDPALGEKFTSAKSKLDTIVADRALEHRLNLDTGKYEWVSRASGKPDDEATALQAEVRDLLQKLSDQEIRSAGAVTGAGIITAGMLCVSTGIYGVCMLVLGVLYFVFKPNTATVNVRYLKYYQ